MRSFLRSFKYAFQGIIYCIKNERNMRIHTVVALYVSVFARFFAFSGPEIMMIVFCFGGVMSTEVINTAIEILCDKVSMKKSLRIRIAKDAAAGAVLIMAVASVIIGLILFSDVGCWMKAWEFYISHPANLALLLSSMALSIVYIAGPRRIWKRIKKRFSGKNQKSAQQKSENGGKYGK